jgi:hypothetical protein
VADFPDRIEALKADATTARADSLQTMLTTVSVSADLAETERAIGDPGGALQALQRAEAGLAKAREFLANPKHRLPEELRRELNERADALRTRLDDLKRSA